MNSKAITGSIMIAFVATIIIMLILAVFVLVSFMIKKSLDVNSTGSVNDEKYRALNVSGIEKEFRAALALKNILNSKGNFRAENASIYDVLGLWECSDAQEIADFISTIGLQKEISFFNEECSEYFICRNYIMDSVGYKCEIENVPGNFDESFNDINHIGFIARPYKIKILI